MMLSQNYKDVKCNFYITAFILSAFCIMNVTSSAEIKTAASDLLLTNIRSKTQFSVSFDYQQPTSVHLDKVRFYARAAGRDLYLGSPELTNIAHAIINQKTSQVDLTIPIDRLPDGKYTLVMKTTSRDEPDNQLLKSTGGRSIISLPDFGIADYELRCRVSSNMVVSLRNQGKLTSASTSWANYGLPIRYDGDIILTKVQNERWLALTRLTDQSCPEKITQSELTPQPLHQLKLRVQGNKITASLDNLTIGGQDINASYPHGYVSFRSVDSGTPAYLDDLSIIDLNSGKTVFADDFEKTGAEGSRRQSIWEICAGGWELTQGVPAVTEQEICQFYASPRTAPLPKVEMTRQGDGFILQIDGQTMLPLLYGGVFQDYPYNEDLYDLQRKVYDAGVRLFAPIVNQSCIDDVMAQLTIACPDAYFLIRGTLPVPADLPESDRAIYRDGSADNRDYSQLGNDHNKVNNDVSLASEHFKLAVPELIKNWTAQVKRSSYAAQVFGCLITGAGYEGNWGIGGNWPYYLVDVSQAQVAQFSRYLKQKYADDVSLQVAWNNPQASLDNPAIPGLAERNKSDLAGFIDPANPERRWVLDFIDMYDTLNFDLGDLVNNSLKAALPETFITRFSGTNLDTCFGIIQTLSNPVRINKVSTLPGSTTILTYGDRKAGGVSIHGNYSWESIVNANTMVMAEVDMHTPADGSAGSEDNWDDVVATMRREFASTVLMRQHSLWYFDMGYTGPWYNHPQALAEFAAAMRVGNEWLGQRQRQSVAEALLVGGDNREWRHYALSPEPLPAGQTPVWGQTISYMYGFVTLAPESAMRLGAPVDGAYFDDLAQFNRHKLYVFPSKFCYSQDELVQIHELVESGAVCVFMGAAGLIDDNSANLDNMQTLLGMKVTLAGLGQQKAFAVTGAHPVLSGLSEQDALGSSRWHDGSHQTVWQRFAIDDPDATVLGRYADGSVAIALKKRGKGTIVYSGVALTLPKMYRNLAKYAGVHVYLDTDDFVSADNSFLMIHTRDAGVKSVKLRQKVSKVVEVFTGEVVATDSDQFDLELPAKTTVVYALIN